MQSHMHIAESKFPTEDNKSKLNRITNESVKELSPMKKLGTMLMMQSKNDIGDKHIERAA